jgi:AraC family transcriptional regulator
MRHARWPILQAARQGSCSRHRPCGTIDPDEIVRRRVASWRDLVAESIRVTDKRRFDCGFSGRAHLLIAYERAVRVTGETRVDGLPASSLHDLGRKPCFVPAGCAFHGSIVPRVPPRATYFFIDPADLPADPEMRFAERDFAPRLFLDDEALWATVTKLNRLSDAPAAGNRLYAEVGPCTD